MSVPFWLMEQTRTYRRLLAGIVFASIGLILAVSGCGSSSEPSRPNGAYSRALKATKEGGGGQVGESGRHIEEAVEGAPHNAPEPPEYAGLSAYSHRCSQINLNGAKARVVYKPSQEMTRGGTATMTAAVTLDRNMSPSRVLRSVGAVAAPAIVVSCAIEAQLSASLYDFNLNEHEWVPRSFLTSDTARWTWYVGPKIGGTQTLVLNVRPIVRLHHVGESKSSDVVERADVQSYPIKVQVRVPWTERPAEIMSRLADTLKVAQGLVEGITGLLLALVALGTAVGVRRSKAKRAPPRTSGDPGQS
jgi:hypothetical protein